MYLDSKAEASEEAGVDKQPENCLVRQLAQGKSTRCSLNTKNVILCIRLLQLSQGPQVFHIHTYKETVREKTCTSLKETHFAL